MPNLPFHVYRDIEESPQVGEFDGTGNPRKAAAPAHARSSHSSLVEAVPFLLPLSRGNMADKEAKRASEAEFAKRIDPKKEPLTPEQIQFIRRAELEQWKKKTQKLGARNIWTGLAIGAIVVGIYGYTFYSVSQEKIMDEIDKEARVMQVDGSKNAAN
ncbi:hypothetical protein GN956_G14727 [Arapaima gigas]